MNKDQIKVWVNISIRQRDLWMDSYISEIQVLKEIVTTTWPEVSEQDPFKARTWYVRHLLNQSEHIGLAVSFTTHDAWTRL